MTRREILEVLHFREILKTAKDQQGEKLCKNGDRTNLTEEAKSAEN